MSFNYLEIEKALKEIRAQTGNIDLTVEAVEFVDFPILKNKPSNPAILTDLNLSIRFEGAALVFGMKAPWVGIFWMPHGAFRKVKNTSMSGFSLSQFAPLLNQKLEKIEQVDTDRIVKLTFSNGAVLQVELFGQRPNWRLFFQNQETQWRAERPLPMRPMGIARPQFEVREFEQQKATSWLERVYHEYRHLKQMAYLKAAHAWALGEIEKRLAHLIRMRGSMQDQLLEARQGERLKQAGTALKAVLYQHPPHYKTDKLEGFEHELDGELTLAQNADRFFDRAKKLQRTQKEVTSRLEELEHRIHKQTALVSLLRSHARPAPAAMAERLSFDVEYAKLEKHLLEAGLDVQTDKAVSGRDAKQKNKMLEAGARQFRSKEGLLIWVGRNQEENEKIVIKVANGNDVWMHLKGRPGAHVIIQVPRSKSASLETLLDGATLAAHYSSIGKGEKVEIDYTFRKYLKRVPGPKFTVTYSQNKTLVIKQEPARLERLLAQDF